jgi:hypothetical protein
MTWTSALVVAVVVAVLPPTLRGQGGDPAEFSGGVPESPAFTFLGVSPARIERPGAARDFALALLNGVDAAGRVQQGFALEVSPWYLVPGYAIGLDAYQKNWLKFVIANAQLSLGTARAAGDSGSTDLAAGLRFTLVDLGDPMRSRAFTKALGDTVLQACAPDTPGATADPGCVGQVTATRFAAWTASHWNARRLSVSVATGLRFVGSATGNSRSRGMRVWLAGANPLGRSGQGVAQVEYAHQPAEGSASGFSRVSYGARILLGSPSFSLFAELLGDSRFATTDGTNDKSGSWSGGVEARVGRNLWISTGFGSQFSALAAPDRVVVIANVRWGIASAARLGALRPGGS